MSVRFGSELKEVKRLIEMDKDVTPVIVINRFTVDPEEVDQFLKALAAAAEVMKQQPGHISTQIHRGIADSSVFVNYQVWESSKHLGRAINNLDFASKMADLPHSTVMSPYLYRKIAVPGICGN
jgi:quinol monooxygenase YgiN